MAKKESAFASVMQKFSAKRELPQHEIKPQVLNDLWNGFHLGAIYSIWAEKGAGKCLEVNSRVATTRGYVTLKSLLRSQEEWQPAAIDLITPWGVETTTALYYGKEKDCLCIKAERDRVVTPNHPILSVKDGVLDMRQAQDLDVGDYLALPMEAFSFAETKPLLPNEAYFLGAVLGDGFCCNTKPSLNIGFQSTDLSFVEEFKEFAKSTAAITTIKIDGKQTLYVLKLKNYESLPKSFDCFKGCTSALKKVPECIFSASIKDRIEFIQGILDTDGTVTPSSGSKSIDITLKSEAAIDGIIDVLSSLGIHASKFIKVHPKHGIYYRLTVGSAQLFYAPIKIEGRRKPVVAPSDSQNLWSVVILNQQVYSELRRACTAAGLNFSHRVGPRVEEKKVETEVGQLIHSIKLNSKFHTSRRTLMRICSLIKEAGGSIPESVEVLLKYHYVPIVEITETVAEVADVCLPEHHLFYANGMLNHNSSLTFQVIKSLCKKGLRGVFVDVEKAFNEFQQKSFGLTEYIDNGQLTVVTVSNWKDYEEIVMALDGEEGIDFFITDSITMIMAFTPKELKVEDVRPGLKAQQAASVLGKLKDIAYRNEIGTILLYHARANIQIVGANPYAPQTKMAGGMADAHIPDVITKIQTHSKIKGDGEDPIGVEISIMCEKNKFTAPFQTRRSKLIFGKGIDAKLSLIETAIELGIIRQSGSSFIIPNHDNVRGRKALYELDNETLRNLKSLVDAQRSAE